MKHADRIKLYLSRIKRKLSVEQIKALDDFIDWQKKEIDEFFENLRKKYQ